jgi:uncharacterized membrane-anchored protein
MKRFLFVLALLCPVFTVHAEDTSAEGAQEPPSEFQSLDWHNGPSTEAIGSKATIDIAEEMAFLDAAGTEKFLRLTGNIPSPNHYVLVSKQGNWWAIFNFDDSGYVKDDEKIDADELLKTLKDSDEAGNEERKRLGISPLYTEGWQVPPHYDTVTKRLEWGLKLRSNEGIVLNYTVRLLGRTGVMNATLVSSPETLDKDVASFKTALAGYEFIGGQRYAEFQPGDKVAEYGLAALVLGGGAAIAAKTGFLAKFWKLIVIAFVGLFAAIGKFFKRLVGKSDE